MEPTTKEEKKAYILSGNRLIGEFMGCSFQMSHISDYKSCPDNGLPPIRYHRDWNKLMDVWFRFRDLKFKVNKHMFFHSYHKDDIARAITYGYINEAYKELVLAINWYNSTKQ